MTAPPDDTPALSDVHYDDLTVGDRMGPFAETVTRDLASRLAGPIGEAVTVQHAPPSAFPVLFLRALRRAMGGIPAGSILAKQELEFHAELPVDSTVAITVWVGEKLVKRERAFVTIEFDVRTEDGAPVVTGRKIIVWPTGPEE
ncbi:MAG: itaconyl-CoA hydratase / mesaconyl-C4 CoA hydratase [Solirubrobacteraceae bacterium]